MNAQPAMVVVDADGAITRYYMLRCDVCGRTDGVTTTDDHPPVGWEIREGENHSPWTVCPRCARGE